MDKIMIGAIAGAAASVALYSFQPLQFL